MRSRIKAAHSARRAAPLAQSIGSKIIEECNVLDIESVDRVFDRIKSEWGSIDFIVHALAYSDPKELAGRYADTTRENFINSMVISCFSFTEIAKRGRGVDAERRLADHAILWWCDALGSVLQRHGRCESCA